MAQPSSYYTDSSVREDLLDVITNLTPTETQLMTGLQTTTAKSVRHEWLKDTLEAAKFNSYIEGAAASYAVTDPTRLINYCQIIRQGYSVTDTQEALDHAGISDRKAYEASKAMKCWKNDAEFSILLNSLNCGSASVARTMNGIYQWVALTNATNQSGISMTEANLLDYLARCWSQGTEVDEVYVGAVLKRRIDGFTAGSTKTVPAADKRLVNAVDVYESSYAPIVKIFLHRYVNSAAGTAAIANAGNIIGIDASLYAVSYLRKPIMRDIARVGDSEEGEIVGELTLEDRSNGLGGFIGQDHF
jgi:hypothetical protein